MSSALALSNLPSKTVSGPVIVLNTIEEQVIVTYL